MQAYLAIDPGLMTGISLWEWDKGQEPVLVWSVEAAYNEYADAVRRAYIAYPDLKVICERFVITAETAKKSQAPYSLELIGQLKLIMADGGHDLDEIVFQKPSDAMAMYPNVKLHKVNYWHKGGAGHALDSIRHGLLYFTKHGWAPRALLS